MHQTVNNTIDLTWIINGSSEHLKIVILKKFDAPH